MDVTSEADKLYMDALNNIIFSRNNVEHLLMGEEWDQDLDEDDEDYTIPLMNLTSSSSGLIPFGLRFRGSQRSSRRYRLIYPLMQCKK